MLASRCGWIAGVGIVLSQLAGCGLLLDYAPPESDAGTSTMDVGMGGVDVGPVACTTDAACDDAIDCTIDTCRAGTCQHSSRCPTGTDCIERGGGVCRRPCTNDEECDDGVVCSEDTCNLGDGHCEHRSTCQDPDPVCLATGACVPSSCDVDADCSDDDACNGIEHCESGQCAGGTPVVCDVTPGTCAPETCDSRLGVCVPAPDATLCDDGVACTVDRCEGRSGGVFSCTSTASDLACDDGNPCTLEACDAATGCVFTDVPCPGSTSCLASDGCDGTTGLCSFRSLCAMGQICTTTGCMARSCTSDANCVDAVDPTGCGFVCGPSHLCVPTTRCPAVGCGVPLDACLPDPAGCTLVPDDAACDDADPTTVDTCDPSTFTCDHACGDRPGNCITNVVDSVSGRCMEVRDDSFCQGAHPIVDLNDCTAWLCTGPDTSTSDGCVRTPVAAHCEDGFACTHDVCMLATDGSGACVRSSDDALCADGAACTTESCDPLASGHDGRGCVYELHDDVCAAGAPLLQCAMPYCAGGTGPSPVVGGFTFPTGCAVRYGACGATGGGTGDAGVFRDGGGTTIAYCNPTTGTCETSMRPCSGSGGCDDGNACNGTETCNGSFCVPSGGVVCPIDPVSGCPTVCDPATGGCLPPAGPACVPLS